MAKVQIELRPFPIPECVFLKTQPGLRQHGMQAVPTLRLTELSPVDLDALCEEFRTSVFEAAGYNPFFNRPEAQLAAERNSDDGRIPMATYENPDASWGQGTPGDQESLNRR